MAPASVPKSKTVSLSANAKSTFANEGTIELSYHRDYTTFDGIFSFVLYWTGTEESLKTKTYYYGIQSYVDFLHSSEDPELNTFFANVGLVIYTDQASAPIIKKIWGEYEKVIIAVISWPRYTISNAGQPQRIAGELFRSARLQAVDAFPNSWVCVRDADTLFPTELRYTVLLANNKFGPTITTRYERSFEVSIDLSESTVSRETITQYIADKIGHWEKTFIELWQPFMEGKSMLFGMNDGAARTEGMGYYRADWHANIPFTFNRPVPDSVYFPITGKSVSRVSYQNLPNGPIKGIDQYTPDYNVMFTLAIRAGIFAGFVNFKKNRPRNLWLESVDYLISRNPSIMSIAGFGKGPESRAWAKLRREDAFYVGDDERILCFVMAAKHLNDVEFVTTVYSDYFSPDFLRSAGVLLPIDPRQVFQWMTFTDDQLSNAIPKAQLIFKDNNNYDENNNKTKMPVYSRHFNPTAVPDMMASRNDTDLQNTMIRSFEGYNQWLQQIMSMSNAELQPYLNKFTSLINDNSIHLKLKRAKTLIGGRKTRRKYYSKRVSMKRRRGRA